MKRFLAFFVLLLLLLLFSGCNNEKVEERSVSGIPVEVHDSSEKMVNYELMPSQVKEQVNKIMPEGICDSSYCRLRLLLEYTTKFTQAKTGEVIFPAKNVIFYGVRIHIMITEKGEPVSFFWPQVLLAMRAPRLSLILTCPIRLGLRGIKPATIT